MPTSLPAYPSHARSLTGVVEHVLGALSGAPDALPPARSAIVGVIDGLGAANLSARAGHARFLTSLGGKRDVALTTFPSTTTTALTSLLTGVDAGGHGIVGYRVRVPVTGRAPDQIKGWERGGLDPLVWQRAEPIMARESRAGRPCFVVSEPKAVGSGFSTATVRGAEVHGVKDPADRAALAAQLAGAHDGALVYLYFSELDSAGHRHGWESDAWIGALEGVDAALRGLDRDAPRGTGILLTADHGMVDVPADRHVLLRHGDPLVEGVEVIAGEPRMLHLHAEEGSAERVLATWREAESHRSWVLSRDEAIGAGLFGEVADEVRARIGDVLVAARADIAYYDDRLADRAAQRMIGQHGSLTPRERIVPLLRAGAFRR